MVLSFLEDKKGERISPPPLVEGFCFRLLTPISLWLVDKGARLFGGQVGHLDAKVLKGLLIQVFGIQVQIPA